MKLHKVGFFVFREKTFVEGIREDQGEQHRQRYVVAGLHGRGRYCRRRWKVVLNTICLLEVSNGLPRPKLPDDADLK